MRLIKKYESFFDADQAVVEIGKQYSDSKVLSLIADESAEWSDSYGEIGNGEAESHVIATMISWCEKKSGKKLSDFEYASLEDALKIHYGI